MNIYIYFFLESQKQLIRLKWRGIFYDYNIISYSVVKFFSFIAIDIDFILFFYHFNSWANQNAVDDKFFDTHSHSTHAVKSWWLVDLGQNYIINEMRINFLPRAYLNDIRVRTMIINDSKMFYMHINIEFSYT